MQASYSHLTGLPFNIPRRHRRPANRYDPFPLVATTSVSPALFKNMSLTLLSQATSPFFPSVPKPAAPPTHSLNYLPVHQRSTSTRTPNPTISSTKSSPSSEPTHSSEISKSRAPQTVSSSTAFSSSPMHSPRSAPRLQLLNVRNNSRLWH